MKFFNTLRLDPRIGITNMEQVCVGHAFGRSVGRRYRKRSELPAVGKITPVLVYGEIFAIQKHASMSSVFMNNFIILAIDQNTFAHDTANTELICALK
jgi:hypothetical protein